MSFSLMNSCSAGIEKDILFEVQIQYLYLVICCYPLPMICIYYHL